MVKLDVLVLGATGGEGSAVVQALLQGGHAVRAVTPDLAHPEADTLRRRGARLEWVGSADMARMRDALTGADALYVVTSPVPDGPAAETMRGLELVDLARHAGVPHVVYSSVMPAAALTGVARYDAKHEVEQYLRASAVPHTIVCPGFCMETLLEKPYIENLLRGELLVPLAPGRRLQQVALADVARFVRIVMERREAFLGRRVCVASDELTATEMAAGLARVMNRSITVVHEPASAGTAWSRDGFAWWDRHAGCASVAALRSSYPEVNWHTLEGWARRIDWRRLGEATSH